MLLRLRRGLSPQCDKENLLLQVRHVESHFGMNASKSIERLFQPEQGGGAMLDIGVYCLSFIQAPPPPSRCEALRVLPARQDSPPRRCHSHQAVQGGDSGDLCEMVAPVVAVKETPWRQARETRLGTSLSSMQSPSWDGVARAARWHTPLTHCASSKLVCPPQFLYAGEEATRVQASATLESGVDTHGTALLTCAAAPGAL